MTTRNDSCKTCGGFGYTIDINDEGVEYMTGCFDCFVEAREADARDAKREAFVREFVELCEEEAA